PERPATQAGKLGAAEERDCPARPKALRQGRSRRPVQPPEGERVRSDERDRPGWIGPQGRDFDPEVPERAVETGRGAGPGMRLPDVTGVREGEARDTGTRVHWRRE